MISFSFNNDKIEMATWRVWYGALSMTLNAPDTLEVTLIQTLTIHSNLNFELLTQMSDLEILKATI